MKIELAEKAQSLMNELHELESLRHGIWKAMLPQDVVRQRVAEYDNRIDEIQKEIEAL
ncbi:MAG: hypothetical protein K2K45_07680 [Muribaculaceae bacterium]|nr:hypothetical protein [Muribaculaceae bacterium]